ncbi:hypothetical protein BGZ57DRAFT_848610 [Hyaloscypha finlandica]|nr:hypothetical protein BGZ57DRAFT_848610 [Hyaloscypha finlandica]
MQPYVWGYSASLLHSKFGFGLTYSTFEYCSISVANTPSADALAIQETTETFVNPTAGESIYEILITVSARVKNTGDWAASEVAQLYVQFPAIEDQPPKILRGFTKLKDMAPGSVEEASFPIRRKDVMVWDVCCRNGGFLKEVSSSSLVLARGFCLWQRLSGQGIATTVPS